MNDSSHVSNLQYVMIIIVIIIIGHAILLGAFMPTIRTNYFCLDSNM